MKRLFTLRRVATWLLFLFILVLPWQTRWIVHDVLLGGDVSQYGRLSIYAFDVLLFAFLVLSIVQVEVREQMKALWDQSEARWLLSSLGGLVVWAALTSIWSVSSVVTLVFAAHLFLAILLFFVLWAHPKVHVHHVLVALSLGMVLPALGGWVQSAVQMVPASSVLGLASQDPNLPGTAVIEHATGRWLRAYGSLPHPNIFGGLLVVSIFALLERMRRGASATLSHIFTLALVLFGGALVMSASRTAIVALAIGGAVYIHGIWKDTHEMRMRLLHPVGIAILVTLLVTISLLPVLRSRVDFTNRLEEKSVVERVDQWRYAVGISAASLPRALFGTGAGAYVYTLEETKPLHQVWFYQPVHIVPMLVFVELGLVGLLFFASSFVALLVLYWRHKSEDIESLLCTLCLVLVVLMCFDHYLWTNVSALYVFAMIAALGAVAARPVELTNRRLTQEGNSIK